MTRHTASHDADDVRALIRVEITRAGGMRALALEWGVDVGQLSRALSRPSDEIPGLLLFPLGLERQVRYVRRQETESKNGAKP